MDKTLDDLIARLTAIREDEGKNLDIVGPGLELVKEHCKDAGGEADQYAVRFILSGQ